MQTARTYFASGTKVKVVQAGSVPNWSSWENDNQRTSTPVKKRLQQLFFKGDRRVSAEVIYISNESERDKLRKQNWVKVQLRDPAGCSIVITADGANLKQA